MTHWYVWGSVLPLAPNLVLPVVTMSWFLSSWLYSGMDMLMPRAEIAQGGRVISHRIVHVHVCPNERLP
jgi:hypothetical protein